MSKPPPTAFAARVGRRRRARASLPTGRPLLVQLQARLPALKGAERLIAESVLKDPERLLSRSIAEFSRGAGASVGSIVAFCRRLGTRGFADFKIALAGELAQAGFSGDAKPGADPEHGSLFERVFEFHVRSLRETVQLNAAERLDEVARLLAMASRIEFFSIGMSYPVAYTACAKFRLIGLPASTESDSHLQLIRATQLRKGDVAFAISCSGSTIETVRCLQIARTRGARTVCLTNCVNSPLTRQADLTLFAAPSEIKYLQAPLAARITQLAMVDSLFVSLALRNRKRTLSRLRNASVELLQHRL